MKRCLLILLTIAVTGCSEPEFDIPRYFDLVNHAELFICGGEFEDAAMTYQTAFENIGKPFGKDVFNAALACQLSDRPSARDRHLQTLINNSDELGFVQSSFVNVFISEEQWQSLVDNRQIDYDPGLRREFDEIYQRDQLFRPLYESHDDTINANRKLNLTRIMAVSESGFPSHQELGYTRDLRGQKHDIVLHHTAQRRSYDKSVTDLEPILFEAVHNGRFDPETAIYYMHFQNDPEKGTFEVYSPWKYRHPLLPDSLNNTVWLVQLTDAQKTSANQKRKEWNANSLDEIATKAAFLAITDLPFVFTSVRMSVGNLGKELDADGALAQYQAFTGLMKEYTNMSALKSD